MSELIQVLGAIMLPFLAAFSVYLLLESAVPRGSSRKKKSDLIGVLVWTLLFLAVAAIVFGGEFIPVLIAGILSLLGLVVGTILFTRLRRFAIGREA